MIKFIHKLSIYIYIQYILAITLINMTKYLTKELKTKGYDSESTLYHCRDCMPAGEHSLVATVRR